ncbi:MAG: hypothetical protein E7162_02735 [Firmicutes bacterium]|nr:hypothetical protein [Bacillota bacterium]
MKSTLKILKDNVFTIFIIIVFIGCMFVLSYMKKVYWDNNNEAIYGDRVEDVKNHVIDDKMINNIETSIEALEEVSSCTYDLEGRIINLTIVVKDDVTVKKAKSLDSSILKNFDNDQLSYYSIQVYFKKNDSSLDDFPIMGYKHYNDNDISWTKDREATLNEDK